MEQGEAWHPFDWSFASPWSKAVYDISKFEENIVLTCKKTRCDAFIDGAACSFFFPSPILLDTCVAIVTLIIRNVLFLFWGWCIGLRAIDVRCTRVKFVEDNWYVGASCTMYIDDGLSGRDYRWFVGILMKDKIMILYEEIRLPTISFSKFNFSWNQCLFTYILKFYWRIAYFINQLNRKWHVI